MERTAKPAADISPDEKARLIGRSFVFRDLDPDLLLRVARLSHVRRLDKGRLLFQQGDEGDALFGVVSGLIRISVVGLGGRELTLGLMEPGDVFGEIALLDALPRTASASAVTDSQLLVIRRPLFLTLVEEEPRLARHLIELLCERLRENTDRLGEFAFLSLRARLAKKLEALAIAHGHPCETGVRIALKLSQTDLAQMLGVTREAVNKQLRSWQRMGILQLSGGYITVINMDRLVACAQAEDEGFDLRPDPGLGASMKRRG